MSNDISIRLNSSEPFNQAVAEFIDVAQRENQGEQYDPTRPPPATEKAFGNLVRQVVQISGVDCDHLERLLPYIEKAKSIVLVQAPFYFDEERLVKWFSEKAIAACTEKLEPALLTEDQYFRIIETLTTLDPQTFKDHDLGAFVMTDHYFAIDWFYKYATPAFKFKVGLEMAQIANQCLQLAAREDGQPSEERVRLTERFVFLMTFLSPHQNELPLFRFLRTFRIP